MSLPTRHISSKNSLQSSKNHKSKSIGLATYALVLGSAAVALTGCQSAPTAATTNSNAMIDFAIADGSQSKAQGQAFNTRLKDNAARYAQLFDQPNTETQAKTRLLSAIRQHLASEQVAVAQAHYQTAPYIAADSIDAGSNSLLKTIIELYAFNQSKSYDEDIASAELDVAEAMAELEAADAANADAEDSCNGVEYDAINEVCVLESSPSNDSAAEAYDYDNYDEVVVEEAAEATAIEYDEAGYDSEGFDQDGYNKEGFDYDGYDENGYDSRGFDYDGHDYYGYTENGVYGDSSNESEYEENSSIRTKLGSLNPKGVLQDYAAMQAKKQQMAADKVATANHTAVTGMIGNILGMFQRTPEQVQASNTYQYKNLVLNRISHYIPAQKQLQSVYSYDYLTPTISSSIQVPLALDFNNNRITIDPSAIMPLVALANPEHTPLPNQMTSHTVDFGLPEAITEQLPVAIIYDAIIAAMQDSMGELAADNFSAIDTKDDIFAKEVGAARAVKVNFGSKQSGEMLGKMLKYVSRSLETYVEANPDKYADDAPLKKAISNIQLYNQGYQSADVGALMQLIEAIGPISFNQVNYYYLDASDRLIGKQQRVNVGGDLFGQQVSVLNQIRYDKASFNANSLTPLLTQSFGANAKPALDGNAWLTTQRKQEERLSQARSTRYSYDDNVHDNEYENDYSIVGDDDTMDSMIEVK